MEIIKCLIIGVAVSCICGSIASVTDKYVHALISAIQGNLHIELHTTGDYATLVVALVVLIMICLI